MEECESKIVKAAVLTLIIIILFLPYFILLPHFGELGQIDFSELLVVFRFTIFESFFSAFFSVFGGVCLGLSLSTWFNKEVYKKIYWLFLLPSFMPTIFIVLSSLNIANFFGYDLSGKWGIVLVHVFINFGLVSALYSDVVQKKMGDYNRISLVYGIRPIQYLFRVLIPLTLKDILFLFLVVFVYSFCSFSVPLVISGVSTTTIEMLIYEKLVVSNDMSAAVSLSLIQFLFLAICYVFILKTRSIEVSKSKFDSYLGQGNKLALFGGAATLFVLSGLFLQLDMNSFEYLLNFKKWELGLNSLLLATGAGLFVFTLSTVMFSVLPSSFLKNLLFLYNSPSTVLIGLAFVSLSYLVLDLSYVWLVISYFILFFPSLFKLYSNSSIESIESQDRLAQVYSLGWRSRFININFPNSFGFSMLATFITMVWVLGDYSVVSIFLTGPETLALEAKFLMKFYRLGESTVILLVLLVFYALLFACYKGILNAFNRKY